MLNSALNPTKKMLGLICLILRIIFTVGFKLIDKEAFFVATDAYQVEGAR